MVGYLAVGLARLMALTLSRLLGEDLDLALGRQELGELAGHGVVRV